MLQPHAGGDLGAGAYRFVPRPTDERGVHGAQPAPGQIIIERRCRHATGAALYGRDARSSDRLFWPVDSEAVATFTFRGFTFIRSKTRRGKFQIKRKSRRTACGKSCKPSNRNCDGACTSRFPSREDGCSRSSPATSTTTRADKRSDTDRVPLPRHQSLVSHATEAEPERLDDLGAHQAVGRRLGPEPANP
jgi:hypothetical protein